MNKHFVFTGRVPAHILTEDRPAYVINERKQSLNTSACREVVLDKGE
jgi:hypothetical protein